MFNNENLNQNGQQFIFYADFAAMSGNNGANGMWNNPLK